MKKIIPMQKEITFRTMIGEITELAIEQKLKLSDDNVIEGNLIVKGLYKMTEASQIEETINELLPVTIELASKYDATNIETSIDDFYYEIINDNILRISVTIAIDKIEDKQEELMDIYTDAINANAPSITNIDSDIKEEPDDLVRDASDEVNLNFMALKDKPEVESDELVKEIPVVIKTPAIDLEIKDNPEKKTESSIIDSLKEESMGSIFSALEHTEETFSTYFVYIVRENDTLDKIIDKYQTTKEELSNYNDLDSIKLGTKLIIPCATIHE